MNILKTNQTNIKYVIHMGDIHCRNNSRIDEFKIVFNNFFDSIKHLPKDETIIVNCGDTFHQKTSMEPEGLQLVKDLFVGCSDLFPTIIIPGNHDGNVASKTRMDAVTPVIELLNRNNIYYLKESGLYGYANILFNHMSVFDEPEKYILGKDIPSVYRNKYERIIGLFHGAVDQSMSDTGHTLENPKIMLPLFDNHHIFMLSDIHLAQNLQEYDYQYDKPIVRYCGSFLQQNHGESSDKGYSLWDLSDMSYTHHNLKNDFGFYTIGIDHGNLVTDISHMPKNVRLRVICKETIPSEVKHIISKLKETHTIIESSFIRETADVATTNKVVSDINLKNIFNVGYQSELIRKHLLEITPDISVDRLDKVLYINQIINKELGLSDQSRTSRYKLIKMEWENMFSYGEDNWIDFTNVNGLYGIFGKNRTGKSSIFSCILFCLFDKCSMASKGEDIINEQKSSFKCKLEFEIDGVHYFIERKGTAGRTGTVKVDVRFWKLENGEEISLHGTERSDTNEIIRGYVGTFDDFILTSAYFQFGKHNLSFIDMGKSDRKDILVKFMGIDVFDKLCNIANEKKKEINSELKIHRGKEYQLELVQMENALNHAVALHLELSGELDKTKITLADVNQKIQAETLKLIKLDSNIPTNIEHLKLSKERVEAALNIEEKNVSTSNIKVKRYARYIEMVERRLKRIEDLNLIENHTKYKLLLDKISSAKKKMDIKKIEIKGKLDKVAKLKAHKYDPNCKFCIDNEFVRDASSCQEQLKQDRILARDLVENLEALEAEFETVKWVDSKYGLYTRLLNKRGELKDIQQLTSTFILDKSNNISKNKDILANTNNNIAIYTRNLTSVENNNSVNLILSSHKIEASSLDVTIQKFNTRLTELYGKIQVFKNNIVNLKSVIEVIKNKETELDGYEKYIEAVGRDGIPYKIICNAIPTIEREVNDILTQISDFTLKLEDDDNDIIPYICSDTGKHVIELCSGAERFEMEFAIRIGLIMTSNLIKCENFYGIDEGFGVLDIDGLSSMSVLFSIIKQKFSSTFIISHQNEIKDLVDCSLDIKKVDGFSQVQHG